MAGPNTTWPIRGRGAPTNDLGIGLGRELEVVGDVAQP